MIGTVTGALVNIILDPVLISGVGMGASGAAIATVIGYISADLIYLFFVLRRSQVLSVSVRNARVNMKTLMQILGIGIPAALANLMQSFTSVMMNQYLLPYGNDKIAVMGIVLKVSMIALLILTGFAFGGQPLFGYYFGLDDRARLSRLFRFMFIFILSVAIVLTLLIVILAPVLIEVFMDDEMIIRDGSLMLRLQVITMPLVGIILLLTVLVTAFRTREYPPEEFARYNGLEGNGGEPETGRKPGFIALMRNIPKTMLQLGVTQFFSWAALFMMWTYLKPAITGHVLDPATGVVLSEGATQTWVGVLNGIYPIPACIISVFMSRIAGRWGNKPVYAACLLCGALGFGGLLAVHNQYLMMLPMVGIGIAWAGILAMPYSILSREVDARNMGAYMGIFNFTITIPQIVIGLTGGIIVKWIFGSNAIMMLGLAGVFMLLAAVSVAFVGLNTEK